MGPDSGVEALALEPNSDVLVDVAYGNMGCWGLQLTMLTPSGRPVPLFRERLDRFWHKLGFNAFDGDAYVDGRGLTLVGAGQKPCFLRVPAPSATGLIAHFRTDGQPAGRTHRFSSRIVEGVQPFHSGDRTFVVTGTYGDSTKLTMTARRPDGSTDPRFGNRGRAWVHLPWRGRNAALDTIVSVTEARPRTIRCHSCEVRR